MTTIPLSVGLMHGLSWFLGSTMLSCVNEMDFLQNDVIWSHFLVPILVIFHKNRHKIVIFNIIMTTIPLSVGLMHGSSWFLGSAMLWSVNNMYFLQNDVICSHFLVPILVTFYRNSYKIVIFQHDNDHNTSFCRFNA